jgi:hypothetical protein
MAVTIKQTETSPDAYPDPPEGLSAAATAILSTVWRRIEVYTAFRTTVRDVTWIVEGCGEWVPPLTPAAIATVEVWQGDAWQVAEPPSSPLGGYMLPGHGPYRFTGTAGDDDADVPSDLAEAFRRLAEYMAADASAVPAGARVFNLTVPGVAEESIERSPAWMAQALINSGAADLLRRYRRA